MYERFTDRAREAMRLAMSEAQRLNHEYISTEHELLGLVKVGGGTASVVLMNANLRLDDIQRAVEDLLTPGPTEVQKHGRFSRWWFSGVRVPQTPRAKKVIEHALEEVHNLNHSYVGTEHLLLGL